MTDKFLELFSKVGDSVVEVEYVEHEDSCEEPDESNEPAKPTAEDLLRQNIEKANEFLDLALADVKGGAITSLYVERVAKLIDVISTAAEKLLNASGAEQDFEIRRELVALKERELELKAQGMIGGPKSLTQNIVMTHKEAMTMIKKSKENRDEELLCDPPSITCS
jgi:hypothetical protein